MGIILSMLMNRLFGPVECRLCMLGLDAAGKTTILYKLKLNDVVTTIPTVGFNVEQVEFQNLSMTVWDVGGQKIIRNLWRHYLQNNDALIYIVDSCDRERFSEAKDELWDLLSSDELRQSSVLVMANKQDLPSAANPAEITEAMDLYKLRDRPWYVQSTCATNGEGLVEGLAWLAEKVKDKKRNS